MQHGARLMGYPIHVYETQNLRGGNTNFRGDDPELLLALRLLLSLTNPVEFNPANQ